jgi:hypothetical protein
MMGALAGTNVARPLELATGRYIPSRTVVNPRSRGRTDGSATLIFANDFASVARDIGLGVEGVCPQARATSLYIRIYPLAIALLKQVVS